MDTKTFVTYLIEGVKVFLVPKPFLLANIHTTVEPE